MTATVLEQAGTVGASWRGRYDRLRLNTCRWTSRLPRSGYPEGTALFPSRDQVVSYLEDYARRHVPDVRLRTCVERIDRHDGGWQLQTSAGPLAARQVIVATGHDHTPRIPAWPGRDRYAGRLLHAAAYRNAQPFLGARVVVVGAGCSAWRSPTISPKAAPNACGYPYGPSRTSCSAGQPDCPAISRPSPRCGSRPASPTPRRSWCAG